VDKLRENYESVDVLINNAAAGLGDLAQAGQRIFYKNDAIVKIFQTFC
jgi:hypothetical protein